MARNWETKTSHGHLQWCQSKRKYLLVLKNEKGRRRDRGKEGTREREKVGREEEEVVEALGYRGAGFIVLEKDDVHLPLVVDAPLPCKRFCQESCLICCSLGGCYGQLFYINMWIPQKFANNRVNVKWEKFLSKVFGKCGRQDCFKKIDMLSFIIFWIYVWRLKVSLVI